MRFMIMHEMTEEMEKGLPPDPAAMQGIRELIEERAAPLLVDAPAERV